MYLNEFVPHRTSAHVIDPGSRSLNRLGIRKIDHVYDKPKGQLLLMVHTREKLDAEVTALLKGTQLILEAPVQLDVNKPFHIKLAGSELMPHGEIDLQVIGFSEIKLKPGYHYSLISCQLVHPNQVKVTLKSSISFNNSNNSNTLKNKHRK